MLTRPTIFPYVFDVGWTSTTANASGVVRVGSSIATKAVVYGDDCIAIFGDG
jgi:hypothetical protein